MLYHGVAPGRGTASDLPDHAQLLAQGCDLGLVASTERSTCSLSLNLLPLFMIRGATRAMSSAPGIITIVCQQCHQALEFSGSDDIDELIQRVEAETAFQVRDHHLQLYGIALVANPNKESRNEKSILILLVLVFMLNACATKSQNEAMISTDQGLKSHRQHPTAAVAG